MTTSNIIKPVWFLRYRLGEKTRWLPASVTTGHLWRGEDGRIWMVDSFIGGYGYHRYASCLAPYHGFAFNQAIQLRTWLWEGVGYHAEIRGKHENIRWEALPKVWRSGPLGKRNPRLRRVHSATKSQGRSSLLR